MNLFNMANIKKQGSSYHERDKPNSSIFSFERLFPNISIDIQTERKSRNSCGIVPKGKIYGIDS